MITMEINKEDKKCLVLLSGGIDSSTALYYMKSSGYNVEGLFIDYKHKSRQKEIQSAAYLANQLDCLLHVIAVPLDQQFFVDARPFDPPLTQGSEGIQRAGLDILLCLSHWLLIANVYCFYLDISNIVLGVTMSDSQRLPKVRWEFLDKVGEVVYNWTGRGTQVLLPFLLKEKKEVVTIGKELGVPFNRTWSCLEQGTIHCGFCEGCKMRRRAFSETGIMDIMQYEVDE